MCEVEGSVVVSVKRSMCKPFISVSISFGKSIQAEAEVNPKIRYNEPMFSPAV